MNDPKAPREPSMEEILASIRRIIYENDDRQGGETEDAETSPAIADDDVLELTEMVKEDGSVVNLGPAEEERQPGEADGQEEPDAAAKPDAEDEAEGESLVSKETAAAATGALGELARAIAKERRSAGNVDAASAGASEELIEEMIRPMLKDWLDRNLPKLVERLVKKELARMVRRAEEQ